MPQPPLAARDAMAQQVLHYWLGDALALGWPSTSRGKLWFGGRGSVDQEVQLRFGKAVADALDDGLRAWEDHAADRLALVILLDQFTRNVYRGQARAFSGDARAQALVRDALARGWDQQLPLAGAVFLYMPLMHAEDLVLQDECVHRFEDLLRASSPQRHKEMQSHLDYAVQHRDIVARFGRFPYRNATLGRASSGDELAFLRDGPRFGQ